VHYAYFASTSGSPYLVKIKLGAGSEFRRIGEASLQADETNIGATLLDAAHGVLYLGAYMSQAKVVMVSTGAGDAGPTRLGATTLQTGERELSTGVIDPAGGYALFGTDHTHPAKVYKMKLDPNGG